MMKNSVSYRVEKEMEAFDKISCEDLHMDDHRDFLEEEEEIKQEEINEEFHYYGDLSEEDKEEFDGGWNESKIEQDLNA